jgi:hypothetical protein
MLFRIEHLGSERRHLLTLGLDEQVQEAKAEEAATINNSDAEEQIDYLINTHGLPTVRSIVGNILNEEW